MNGVMDEDLMSSDFEFNDDSNNNPLYKPETIVGDRRRRRRQKSFDDYDVIDNGSDTCDSSLSIKEEDFTDIYNTNSENKDRHNENVCS